MGTHARRLNRPPPFPARYTYMADHTYLRAVKAIELQHRKWDGLADGLDHHQESYQCHPHAPAHLGRTVHVKDIILVNK